MWIEKVFVFSPLTPPSPPPSIAGADTISSEQCFLSLILKLSFHSRKYTLTCVWYPKRNFFSFFPPSPFAFNVLRKSNEQLCRLLVKCWWKKPPTLVRLGVCFLKKARECVENMSVTHHYCNVLLSWKGVRNINFHDIHTPPLNVVKLGHRYRLYWSTLLVKGINFYRRLRRLLMTSFLGILFFRKSLLISSLG